ncbi:MAG TPA: KaiC domain-containing protein, partial [Methanocorpusculum sp.]|nr:KaiC domain-containing protein [Methanocorpusculum sp.]
MENDPQSRVMIPSGIPGLDEMIGGGFIKDSVFVLIGETGTGRTMFSLQFLHEGLLQGEKVMYISLFNPVEQLTANFLSIYPDMSDRINKDLYIIQLPPEIFLTFSSRHGNNVAVMIKELGISRVVV